MFQLHQKIVEKYKNININLNVLTY